MCDLLHHRVRVHLKTPARNSKHMYTIVATYMYLPYNKGNARSSSWNTQRIMECCLLAISRQQLTRNAINIFTDVIGNLLSGIKFFHIA